MLETYVEKITALKDQGQVVIDLQDIDLEFFLCDTLDRLQLKYERLLPPRNIYQNDKLLIIKLAQ